MGEADARDEDKFFVAFKKHVAAEAKVSEFIVDTLMDALLFQPTNYTLMNQADDEHLEAQEEFQNSDLVLGELVKFMNMLDKGYRARAVNEAHNQLTARPVFVKSDQRFRGRDTLYSASVASDRGGKERMVNVSKRCGIIARGFQPRTDPTMFNNLCLCWMF